MAIDQQTTHVHPDNGDDASGGATAALDLGVEGLTNYVQIGRGGFATVYAADEPALGRKVAVKVLRHLDDDGVRRFEREARTLADLGSHENLAVIHRFARTSNGNPCLIMEYVPGGSLADVLARNGPIEARTALSYGRQVARALIHTHGRGIVHRDIKPSNILLTDDGKAKLSDFGIAILRSGSATLNAATFEHAAPEVFTNGSTKNDERSDLYSLASTLFTLIHGAAPYHVAGEPSHEALMHRVLNAPPPVTAKAPQLDGFWPKALAKDPAERFQTASEMLAALTALGRTPPSAAPQPAAAPRPSAAVAAPQPPPVSPAPSAGGPAPPPPPPNSKPTAPPPPQSGSNSPTPPPRPTTIAVNPNGNRPLTAKELAIVDSYATSPSVDQRREVAMLTTTQDVLFGLAQDADDTVAATAVSRLTDPQLLGRLVEPTRPKQTRVLAAGQVTGGPLASQLADDLDPDVRAALAGAVSDPTVIGKLIRDPADQVRSAVVRGIDEPRVLRLLAADPAVETRRAIAHHVKDRELRLALAVDVDSTVRHAALTGLDAKTVARLAVHDDPAVSRSAVSFIADDDALADLSSHATVHVQVNALDELARRRPNGEALVRIAGDAGHPQWPQALARITDEGRLADLARNPSDPVAEAALARITNPATLTSLALDAGYRLRHQAAARVTDQGTLQQLAADGDRELAAAAGARVDAFRHRGEQLATARIIAGAAVVIAVAAMVVMGGVRLWPLLLIVAAIVGYRAYASSLDGD